MLTANWAGFVTAVTELPGPKLVMLLDVEKVLSETTRHDDEFRSRGSNRSRRRAGHGLFAPTILSVARKQIERILDALGVRYVGSVNGRQAWDRARKARSYASSSGRKVKDMLALILTDVEMPEMDGYILTKRIKTDLRSRGAGHHAFVPVGHVQPAARPFGRGGMNTWPSSSRSGWRRSVPPDHVAQPRPRRVSERGAR